MTKRTLPLLLLAVVLAASACPEIAMLAAVRVKLSSSLGDRMVVDGSPQASG